MVVLKKGDLTKDEADLIQERLDKGKEGSTHYMFKERYVINTYKKYLLAHIIIKIPF